MQNNVVLVSDIPKRYRFMLYLKKKKNNKTMSFYPSNVPKRGTLVPGRAELQISGGGVISCYITCIGVQDGGQEEKIEEG